MLAAVLSAAHCARRSQQELRDLTTHALQALRLAAVATVERLEETAWQEEAARDAGVAEGYQQAAEWAQHQQELDAAHAAQDRQREKYYEHVSEREQSQADRLFAQARRDDAVRLELLQNLTSDQEREAALEQQERDAELHTGIVCGNHTNKFIGALCRVIGGTTDLPSAHYQKLIEDEKIQMVHESQQLATVQKHEFLEQLVGSALQGQAARYNATAAELLETAQAWDSQAARAAAAAARDQEEAAAWTQQEHTLEARAERTEAWETQNESLAQTLWREAERDGRLAERHALEGLVWALVGLVYFLPRVVRKITVAGADVVSGESLLGLSRRGNGPVVAHGQLFCHALHPGLVGDGHGGPQLLAVPGQLRYPQTGRDCPLVCLFGGGSPNHSLAHPSALLGGIPPLLRYHHRGWSP